jgi:hypothetical protein
VVPADWHQADTIFAMTLTVRTDKQLEDALDALAESEGISKQEIIRRAVLDRYERAGHHGRVEDSAKRMSERWDGALDHLGTE